MNPSLVIPCPQCGRKGDWFAAPHGPFCSRRCRLVDLGRWFNEEHAISEPLRPEDFAVEGERPTRVDPNHTYEEGLTG